MLVGNYQWGQSFWFYLIIYIHTACMLLGILHFTFFARNNVLIDTWEEKINLLKEASNTQDNYQWNMNKILKNPRAVEKVVEMGNIGDLTDLSDLMN